MRLGGKYTTMTNLEIIACLRRILLDSEVDVRQRDVRFEIMKDVNITASALQKVFGFASLSLYNTGTSITRTTRLLTRPVQSL